MKKGIFKVSVTIAVSFLIIVGVAFVNRGKGPFYKGRRLTVWLQKYQPNWPQADEAVKALGTNALPTVISLLNRPDGNPYDAVCACESLGPLAVATFPLLTNLCNRNCGADIPSALVALKTEEALEFVINGLNRKSANGRILFASALERAGPVASNAVPLLIACTTNANKHLRAQAARSLGHIGTEADTILTVLTNLLHDSSSSVRGSAVYALGQLGERAKPAVPALLEMRKDPDEHVRFLARAYLHEIDDDLANRLDAEARAKGSLK